MTPDHYLRSVAFELRDLPWKMRRNLISELRGHLAELPTETNLGAQLGTPQEYAAELREAAGLDRRRGLIAFLRARRPRNVILTVVVLAVLGLSIGSAVWIQKYQPLGFANMEAFPAGYVVAPAGDSASVVFRDGRPFRFGVEIRNRGRYPVRVLGVPFGSGEPFRARLFVQGPSLRYLGDYGQSPLRRFRPFDLDPGHSAVLMLKGVYANCGKWPGAGSTLLSDFPVRYSFLWRTTTAEIPPPDQLAIVFKKKNNCR